MNKILSCLIGLCAVISWTSCQMTAPGDEQGPERTIAFYVEVQSSAPGVMIETNNVAAGRTPLTLKIYGDAPGNFHNFGSPEFTMRAVPVSTNEFVQTRIFKTGGHSSAGDRIPGLVFFDMTQQNGALLIDSIPVK